MIKKKKVIYLAAHTAKLDYDNVVYQEINGSRDIGGCMLDVDLSDYDILIATPPCNYYSRANYRRETSEYAQKTKHLLPDIIKKFEKSGKPFIVENVINKVLMSDIIKELNCFYIEVGRHSYFTNVLLDYSHIPQTNYKVQDTPKNKRQGGFDVNNIFNYFLENIL